MPRIVQFTVPAHDTDAFVEHIQQIEIISLRIQRGISIQPPGDVVTIEAVNRVLPEIMRLCARHGIGSREGTSIVTSEPKSVVSAPHARPITHDLSESPWEEIESELAKESNATANALVVMAAAGAIAVLGIATDALHLVVGAMIIAPGFEPISRVAHGFASRSRTWRHGLLDTGRAYAALLAGAAAASLILQGLDRNPLSGSASYLPQSALLSYWLTISIPSLLVAAVAGVAGALLIATNRSVLTAGVMVALSLVPSAAMVGMGLAGGNMAVAGTAFLRWTIEVGLVFSLSLVVFVWKYARVHRRAMMY